MSEESWRALKRAEIDLAKTVFLETLPFGRILIGNHLSFDCPWMETKDAKGIGTGDDYILHLGEAGFPDATSMSLMPHDQDPVQYTFIHELTHVWQSYHGVWVFTKAMPLQIWHRVVSDVYEYEIDSESEWNDFNVEQQAKIVEHWFVGGMSEEDERYQFIRDHIRNCGCE